MKKLFLISSCLFCLTATTTTYAQSKEELKAIKDATKEAEKTLKKAKQTYEGSIANPQYGRKETDYTKLEPAKELIESAMQNQYTKDNPETYKVAADIYYQYFMKLDPAVKADESLIPEYLDVCQKVVYAACQYDKLAPTNPKAKPEDLKKDHTYYQTMAVNPLLMCLQNAQNISGKDGATVDDQKLAVKLSNLVSTSFATEPLFADFQNPGLADWKLYANVFAAQPLLSIPDATDAQIEEAFGKLLDTKFAESAYLQLAGYFSQKGNTKKYQEYLVKGAQAFPENHALAQNLFNAYTQNKEYAKANETARQIIEKFPEDKAQMLYYIGVNCFNMEKFEEAYQSFTEAYDTEQNPDYLKNKAVAIYQLIARDDNKDKAKTKALYDEAIPVFEAYKEAAPDDSDFWGANLYRFYVNTNNTAKAAEYKKYYKN